MIKRAAKFFVQFNFLEILEYIFQRDRPFEMEYCNFSPF